MKKETKEVIIINLSLKGFIKKAKASVRKFFVWVHKKLTILENKILKKLDTIGKHAEEKLSFRLGDKEPIVD